MAHADREKWDAKWTERGPGLREPAAFLVAHAHLLPTRGRALDLAGGAGRNALWLARRGLDVTLADISPVALAHARAAAAEAGLALETVAVDLEAEGVTPPAGPWDAIVVHHYLHRPLFRWFPTALAPGGVLVFVQPTRTNLERHEHPSARFLLEDGELPELLEGLEPLVLEEGWTDEGRHEARLVARRR